MILARRAADAVRELNFPEKNAPLRTLLLLDPKTAGTTRTAALRALTVDDATVPALITVLNRSTDGVGLRRAAADQLALPAAGAAGRAALVAAVPTAQNGLAVGLARTDAGAATVIDSVTAGPTTLLRDPATNQDISVPTSRHPSDRRLPRLPHARRRRYRLN